MDSFRQQVPLSEPKTSLFRKKRHLGEQNEPLPPERRNAPDRDETALAFRRRCGQHARHAILHGEPDGEGKALSFSRGEIDLAAVLPHNPAND
jgi:hypothetical protein